MSPLCSSQALCSRYTPGWPPNPFCPASRSAAGRRWATFSSWKRTAIPSADSCLETFYTFVRDGRGRVPLAPATGSTRCGSSPDLLATAGLETRGLFSLARLRAVRARLAGALRRGAEGLVGRPRARGGLSCLPRPREPTAPHTPVEQPAGGPTATCADSPPAPACAGETPSVSPRSTRPRR